jgi:uncharacterized membrane protein
MIKNAGFIQQLFKEMTDWVDLGLISPDQRKNIENHYLPSPAPAAGTAPEKDNIKSEITQVKDNINLSKVIIGLATLCLAIGIVIFYASNWRKMPPVLKLVQIFILIMTTYGGAYWFLQAERKFSLVGRALLILGIISYGTGIMLVAQVYHISSHPTNGLLAWGIGAFAISILMREKYGAALSMILFIIWDIWEYSYFGNPGYFFGLPVVIMGWLSWREKESKGLTGSALLFAFWFLQISFYWIDNYSTDGPAGYLMIAGFIIAGALMLRGGEWLKKNTLYKNPGFILYVTGWIAYALPLFQIDHLQPEKSYCLILWASAILAVSAIPRDKKGYYLSAFLYFVWSTTSATPAYGYIIPVIILSVLFYLEKDDTGISISAISIVYYYYFFTVKMIPEDTSYMVRSYLLVMLQFPFAAFLITAGKNLQGHSILNSAGKVFTAAGWISFLIPFAAVSWPINMQSLPLLIKFGAVKAHAIEYIILSSASFAGLYLLFKKQENLKIILPVVLFPVLIFLLPFNHTTARMITLHLAAVGFIFLLLYYSYSICKDKSFERTFAYIFSIFLIVIKGTGFISYSEFDEGFKLAYLIGFILFVTVCFLINRLVNEMLSGTETVFPVRIFDAVCAAGVWISIYLASFQVESQKSIFTAESIVIKMTVMFIVLSVMLYFILFNKVTGERVILYLSLIIFISSGITLFTAGPGVPWEMYSITFNLLLFVTSAVYMYYSTIVQSKKILNFATAGIIIHVFTRYFDLFWDMFSGSLLFIITGVLGLAGGYFLEKKRKNLTDMIKTSGDAAGNQERVK